MARHKGELEAATVDVPKKLTGPMANRQVYKRLNALEVGGCLTLMKAEWKARTSPMATLLYSKTYRGQFLVRRLARIMHEA
jgi:hypothetical protein